MSRAKIQGVIRYDSNFHTEVDVHRMTPFMKNKIKELRASTPHTRLVITQRKLFPGDGPSERKALALAISGFRLI